VRDAEVRLDRREERPDPDDLGTEGERAQEEGREEPRAPSPQTTRHGI